MPPDDTDGLDDADLPGLDEIDSSDDSDGLDDSDLPGLDEIDSSSEPREQQPQKPDQPEGKPIDRIDETPGKPDLSRQSPSARAGRRNVFQFVKAIFGQGDIGDPDGLRASSPDSSDVHADDVWVDGDYLPDSAVGDLTPIKGVADYPRSPNADTTGVKQSGRPWNEIIKSYPRWVFVGGGFGILGLVLTVGFFLRSGNTDDTAVAVPSETPVADTAPPSTEVIVVDTQAPAVALAVADVSAAAFPPWWNFTATKTKTIVPGPDFQVPTPIGAVLPWSVPVTESCIGDACTYISVIRPLIPESVLGEVPEATWVVDGAEWSLDVTWPSNGPECVIEKHWVYQFTVTEAEVIDGRSVATAFAGTWTQTETVDSCDVADPWHGEDEWSVVGVMG